IRRHLYQGFARAALLGDESELASFVTYGFAELEFQVRPTRQDLVLSLFKVLMDVFLGLNIPVVVAFDQLEDLLLARRSDDGHRVAEAFFAGIVRAMHQLDGICYLIFAERGLWNRFVPSLDGYIQDRLNNPVHVPGHGTVKALRLEAPAAELVRRVVEVRMAHGLEGVADRGTASCVYPFTEDQVEGIARAQPTLRDMLQQFRQLFDHLVFGEVQKAAFDVETTTTHLAPVAQGIPGPVKSVVVVEVPTKSPALPRASADEFDLRGMWEQALADAKTKLE